MRAVIDATDLEEDIGSVAWLRRLTRWLVGLMILPLCWVTMWTLLSRFSHATFEQGFWQTEEFWFFSTGALVMVGWFCSGLLEPFFIYLYVLGHEVTHAVFVWVFRGKVMNIHVSSQGGHITTNKTNLMIALSPYFVPFWAVVCGLVYAPLHLLTELPRFCDLAFYGITGVTWTFHMMWTLSMIRRDQPDLKENGIFLSLVVIFLANLLVLVGLLCVGGDSPVVELREFAREWLRLAATWGDIVWRSLLQAIPEFRASAKF